MWLTDWWLPLLLISGWGRFSGADLYTKVNVSDDWLADWWLLLLLISGRGNFSSDPWQKGLWAGHVSESVICRGIGKTFNINVLKLSMKATELWSTKAGNMS